MRIYGYVDNFTRKGSVNRMIGRFYKKSLPLVKDDQGSIVVETALVMAFIGVLSIGIIDFGLAYVRAMEVTNAIRSGIQYTIVRKPVDGDFSHIEAAVRNSLPASSSSSAPSIDVSIYCQCPDGGDSDCLGIGGIDLTCDDGSAREAYLTIYLKEEFTLLFPYPGVGSTIAISKHSTIRMN